MKTINTFKHAFTMIELIFVIIILGIVSSIGSQIIVQVYEGYIIQKAVHDASVKTELAINQLANRLVYRIDMSMLARKEGAAHLGLADADAYAIQNLPLANVNDYPILEWIGYDNDGLSAYGRPAWSGFTDLNSSTFATLKTTGSQLDKEGTIMSHYTGSTTEGAAIIFLGDTDYRTDVGSYAAKCMYRGNGCIFPITISAAGETFNFHSGTTNDGDRLNGVMKYTEFYQLATSAFAVVPENEHKIEAGKIELKVHDLKFYYGYQPWEGENYTNGSNALLLENVSVFRFKKEPNSIRIKICVVERIGDTEHISICKEKAVIR